jgi:hypothetical protein
VTFAEPGSGSGADRRKTRRLAVWRIRNTHGSARGITERAEGQPMKTDNQPGEADLPAPGPDAELVLSINSVPPGGALKGRVPADQAHHLITTSGILASGIAGITGAVLTLHAPGESAAAAYAELALALIAAVLIAVCGRSGTRGKSTPGKTCSRPPPHSSHTAV